MANILGERVIEFADEYKAFKVKENKTYEEFISLFINKNLNFVKFSEKNGIEYLNNMLKKIGDKKELTLKEAETILDKLIPEGLDMISFKKAENLLEEYLLEMENIKILDCSKEIEKYFGDAILNQENCSGLDLLAILILSSIHSLDKKTEELIK